jgi:hypothetical protein
MKRLISVNLAGNLLLISLGLLAILHILVLIHVVPSDIVWGGQMRGSATNLLVGELIALFVTLVFMVIIAVKMDYIKPSKFKPAVNIGIWIIFAYLILNTVGNLASSVSLEKLLLAPITLILAFCALRLAIEKQA